MSSRFEMKPCDSKLVRNCMASLGLPHFIAATCVARGYDTPDEIEHYLNPSLDSDWGNPLLIPGMEQVAEALRIAILENKKIVVFGDFDLDGISATTVLTRGLRALGGNVAPFIPDRFKHGYGLSMEAFSEIEPTHPDILITVDCGIANKEEVRKIKQTGTEVIITDHHEAGDLVPEDVIICDPKYKGSKEDATLAGVGVALKVIDALGARFGFPHLWRSYTDFASLGTIADMMPFHFQNRALVKDGIQKINKKCRPCIQALLSLTENSAEEMSSSSIAFCCVPRLNASGRMGKSKVSLDLLLSDNLEESMQIAFELESLNSKRKEIETLLSKEAFSIAREKWDSQRCLIVSKEGWHEGVKGIVSARLVDEFEVPSFLFTIDGDEARGSGRSVGDIDLFEVVNEQRELLTRYGGHKNAVGVTLPTANLNTFETKMNEALLRLDPHRFQKTISIDTVVSLDELTIENVELLQKCGPFGQENKKPVFLAKNLNIQNARSVGAQNNHLLCKLSNKHTSISCINFNCKNISELQDSSSLNNAVFTADIDTWRGTKSVKVQASTLKPTHKSQELLSLSSDEPAEFVENLYSSNSNLKKHPKRVTDNLQNRYRLEDLANYDILELENQIIKALIGNNTPHRAQMELLEHLKNHRSCLGVMATGRGKSLVFQAYATLIALTSHSQSIFIYPLRALMADQACHLTEKLKTFGIKTAVLNGETTQDERKKTYENIKNRSIDILLTTPEYLQFHTKEIAEVGNFGFLVIDEAHHINEAKLSRVAYGNLGNILDDLNNPTTIALTATATKEAQANIKKIMRISDVVFDETVRANLHINDKRNITNRDDYVANLISKNEKTVIYVGTREQTVTVARRLRVRVPLLSPYICFYNAGLSREERKRIEDLFRNDQIGVLVATSAFGEGIDIPNIKNVVLYHMPTDAVQFNQMSGRAGRNGDDSWIHLLYSKKDVEVNEAILSDLSPDRDMMAVIYKRILNAINENRNKQAKIDTKTFAKQIGTFSVNGHQYTATPNSVESAIKVFSELGILQDQLDFSNNKQVHTVHLVANAPKVELTDSSRYCEGKVALENFENFKDWALKATIREITDKITSPIF